MHTPRSCLFLLCLRPHFPTTRYGIPDSFLSGMTDRILGASGVLEFGPSVQYTMVCPDFAIVCRSAGLTGLPFGGLVSEASLSSTIFSPIYSTGGLWRFSKVRTSLIEVGQRLHPSFFVRLSFTLGIHWIIVVPWTIFSHLTALDVSFTRLSRRPPSLFSTLDQPASAGEPHMPCGSTPSSRIPRPRALLFRLTINTDRVSVMINLGHAFSCTSGD